LTQEELDCSVAKLLAMTENMTVHSRNAVRPALTPKKPRQRS
jgi:hypothetical protein